MVTSERLSINHYPVIFVRVFFGFGFFGIALKFCKLYVSVLILYLGTTGIWSYM